MKVSLTVINKHVMKWKKDQKHQRMGQYLMNQLVPKEVNSTIFYEEDPDTAYKAFVAMYAE